MIRRIACLVVLLGGGRAAAQSVELAEAPRAGDLASYSIDLTLTGQLLVTQGAARDSIPLEARAKHRFSERVSVAAEGMPSATTRHYSEAVAATIVAGEKAEHRLPADRRLIVCREPATDGEGLFCACPSGPLSRDELDLVTEQFNPHCLAGLLPGRATAVGASWAVSNAAARAAGALDSLGKNTLAGKLAAVADGVATVVFEGAIEGTEKGARVALKVTASGRFDVASRRLIELDWRQTDDREQGHVHPASHVEARVVLKRESLKGAPAELDPEALGRLPAVAPGSPAARLRYADPRGRFLLQYGRDWHVTSQSDAFLILRLLDRGGFVAQATVTPWKKAEKGKHASPEEFKKAIAGSPSWAPVRLLEDGESPAAGGRWAYRVVAEGRAQEQAIIQAFHLVAGPEGDQAAVTFTMRPEMLKAFGSRGLELVNAVEFGAERK